MSFASSLELSFGCWSILSDGGPPSGCRMWEGTQKEKLEMKRDLRDIMHAVYEFHIDLNFNRQK